MWFEFGRSLQPIKLYHKIYGYLKNFVLIKIKFVLLVATFKSLFK